MFVIFFVFLILISSAFPAVNNETVIAFGEFLGVNAKTPAYHNGSSMNDFQNFICMDYQGKPVECALTSACNAHQKVFTGWKWQCVEYARRWLIQNKGITFSSVDFAYMIWDLEHANKILTLEKTPLAKFTNHESFVKPEIGDLLIYDISYAPLTGHVAVVVGLEGKEIYIAEQNVSGKKWQDSYSRRLPLIEKNISSDQFVYGIPEHGLMGWIRMHQ